jgi:glycosyltransferase involved in cell wall biosynthesis
LSAQICIDARISPGEVGGVEQVILGLAGGMAALDLGDLEITFLTSELMAEQILPLFKDHPNLSYSVGKGRRKAKLSYSLAQLIGSRVSQQIEHILYLLLGDRIIRIPRDQDLVSDDYDLFHFPSQSAFSTSKPNIYHPHDLQHIHLPQYFSRSMFRIREFKYRLFCEQATAVAVTSSWIKEDVVRNYHLPDDKVRVIPFAPPTQHYETPDFEAIEGTRVKLGLPEKFIFYPAQTWPHKNHLSLVRAVAQIKKEHGFTVPMVFSGRLTPFKDEIQTEIDKLDLGNTAQFLGFVSPLELQVLYSLCTAVVIPSLFEAASFPLWEAYLAGAATACAATTSLPRQADDASLIFDPNNDEEIANAVYRLWRDEELRADLITKGRRRLDQFNWESTCSQFVALYRQILGLKLNQADQHLLSRKPIL